ncbi:MAG: hypothetical protein KC503_27795 [Myxococcales bacterium]|nr:hypothetical protein [Myxococcales bacterium]
MRARRGVTWTLLAAATLLAGCGAIARDPNTEGFVEGTLETAAGERGDALVHVHEGGAWVQVALFDVERVENKAFELWLVRASEALSLGQFNVGSDGFGTQWRALETNDAFEYDSVLITRELHDPAVASAVTPSDQRAFEGKLPRP